MCELSPVSFHGDTIFVIEFNDQPFTPIKPIVENLGLDWASQFTKLRSNKIRWGIAMITIPSDGGEQKMVSMPVRKLPAYLASINPKKVREELRAKIELYQNESDDALWNYWMNGRAERKVAGADASLTPDQQCTLRAIVKAKIECLGTDKKQRMTMYAQIWSRFANHFRLAKYSQLPQTKMSEAVEYLTKFEFRQKNIESCTQNPMPSIKDLEGEMDNATYMEGKKIFDLLGELKWKLENAATHIMLSYPARDLYLTPEKLALFENVTDNIRAAAAGVNIAIYNIRSACRVKGKIKFVKG